jgi:hypothetical protein
MQVLSVTEYPAKIIAHSIGQVDKNIEKGYI